MNIVFDVDDTLYDLMAPFQAAHEKFFSSQTAADATELFMKSRLYSDMILAQEKQGLTAPEDAFAKRIQMTYQDVGLSVSLYGACAERVSGGTGSHGCPDKWKQPGTAQENIRAEAGALV